MTRCNLLQALNAAMAHEMARDERVILLGEDVGTAGGIFRVSHGLQQRFGAQRVIDTPLDEKGIAAHAVGLAMFGMRPIVEMQFAGFIHDAHEQIMFCAAKYRWATGGEYSVPLVIRTPSFGGIMGGFWHSQSPETYYIHGGGMKVVAPSTPQDAYRLLLAGIRDPDPVLVLEPAVLYRHMVDELADDGVALPIGKGVVARPGSDVTLVTYGPLRHAAVKVADSLAVSDGMQVEVIDLRSLVPWDVDLVVESVRRTGRLVLLHEAPQTLGFGAEIATEIQHRAFGYLQAPIERICSPDSPYPYRIGDEYYRPNAQRIAAGLRRSMEFSF